jgi:tyrosyl-tRNA synthetase
MSKSLGNAIGINEPPSEMYGKLMSISDELMWRFYMLLTDLPQSKIDAMQADIATGRLHPMLAKKNLARTITSDFHGDAAATAAAENWSKQFQQKSVAEDLPVVEISRTAEGLQTENEYKVPKLLHLAGLAASTGEATRKLAENAVSINGAKFSERTISAYGLGESPTIRLGKKTIRIQWID